MLLEVAGLHFRYLGSEALALADVYLSVGEGEFLAMAGPAGSGKTTLAACLNGTVPHFQDGEWAGEVRLLGTSTRELSPGALAGIVGTVHADPERRFVASSVEEEVAFGLENLALPRIEIEARLTEALAAVGLSGLRHRAANTLSGGEKGRLALAAVLALRPRLLVLDEPVAELDPAGAAQVMEAVAALNRRGTAVVLCESRLANAVAYARRLVILAHGRILADGLLRDLVADEELLQRAGLVQPLVVRAALDCRAAGLLRGGKLPVTMEELRQAVNLN